MHDLTQSSSILLFGILINAKCLIFSHSVILYLPRIADIQILMNSTHNNFDMQYTVSKRNDHSLGPDYFTGWKMNASTYKFKQFPLFFTNPSADHLSKTLTSFGSQQPYRVVYMGPRYTSNFKAFKTHARTQLFEESFCKHQNEMYGQFFLKYDFKYLNQKQKAFPIRPLEYRLFTGMNPTIKKDDLRFDANFQCGNLDLAISINSFEYDLLMRVDSNTRGHTTWFYFKVTNFSDNQKVKFNIINFQKNGLMYKDGMKPYCYRSSTKKWEQEGINVEYRPKKFRYSFQSSSNVFIMNSLSFMYQFKEEDEYVYFAYCVPYTYSYLMHRVASLQKENPHFVQIQRNFFSTGGLEIPVLTITNSKEEKDKPYCLVIGRLHPGQTQGSWVLDGFLRFICSPSGYYLRQKMVFKVIPMVNVDGVVLGNFRTGISGRDMNRVFDQPHNFCQIAFLRQLAQKHTPLIFLDFHGHSAKKNVFMYGPNYGVDHKHYLTCRLFPKFISRLTSVFRYYSCIFRISKSKVNTGRSIMINEHSVAFSFTIESSSYAYGPKNGEVIFSVDEYRSVGSKIAEGMQKFMKIILILPKRLQKMKEGEEKIKEGEAKQEKRQDQKQKQPSRLSPKPSRGQIKQQTKQLAEMMSNLFNPKRLEQLLGPQQKDLISELINDEKQMGIAANQKQELSDSDFEDGDDYSEKQLKKMFKSQIEDQISIEKIKKKKRVKNKKQSIQKLESPTHRPSVSPQKRMNSIKLLTKQKSEDHSINKINYKQRSLDIDDEKLPSIKGNTPRLPQIEQFQTINSSLNKVYYNNWKKDLSPMHTLEKKYKKISSSLNHITLDYNLDKEKQEEYEEEKRKRQEKEKHVRSRFHRERQRQMEKSQKKIMRNYSLKSNMDDLSSRQVLLPIISKNKSFQFSMIPGLSPVEEILANHERIQKNYVHKNIKIVYF